MRPLWGSERSERAGRLDSRFATSVHGDRRPWRKRKLRAMRNAAELVGHVPVARLRRSRNSSATLHVLRDDLPAPAIDVGTHGRARDGAHSGGDVVAAPATDLGPEHGAENAADDGARHVGTAAGADLLLLDPTTLLGRSDNRANRGDIRRIKTVPRI